MDNLLILEYFQKLHHLSMFVWCKEQKPTSKRRVLGFVVASTV